MNEWINIETRKPPNGVYVLVVTYDARPNVKMNFIQIAERFNNDWFEGKDGHSILGKGRSVTHWMPLPEHPKIPKD